MFFKYIDVSLEGRTPLIMHSGQTSDPLNPFAKKLKAISSVRKKTDDHHAAMGEIEWEAGLYWSDDMGLYMPSENIFAMLIKAAKRLKLGQQISAVSVDDAIGFPIQTKNSKNKDALKADENTWFRKAVCVQRARVIRTRPIFRSWSLDFTLELDTTMLQPEQVQQILDVAGKSVGLGDWRPGSPSSPGPYGKFTVEKFEVRA